MNVPFLCIGLAFSLLYLTKIPVAIAMRQKGGYDNRNPRDQQGKLEGWGRRALAAHQNSFEAFPSFAIAVLIAHFAHADAIWSVRLAIAFIVARIFYTFFYLKDLPTLRSISWILGISATAGLMCLGIFR